MVNIVRQPGRGLSEAGGIILMIALQIGILQLNSVFLSAGACILATVVAITCGLSLKKTWRTFRGFLVLLVPVLLLQILASGYSYVLLIDWANYFTRLVAAALVARTLLLLLGATGVQRGLQVVLRPLPRRIAEPLGMIVGAALYLIPGIAGQVQNARWAGTVRFAGAQNRGSNGSRLHRSAAILRAVFLRLITTPQGRAEAMVVRGVLDDTPVGNDR